MPHSEFQSVSRMKENFTYGLTGRDWEPTYDLVNKSLCNRKSRATGYQIYEARHQSFTLLAVLGQILQQTILELTELKSILSTGGDTLGLLQEVNRGINDSMSMAKTLGVRVDPGIYRELTSVDQAVRGLETVYGSPVRSPLETVQRNTDQTVAEAITFNNELNDYAHHLDQIGEDIKVYSHDVSPGGAAKLTAESLGVMIHVMNQQLRATGVGLKLQAQAMATENKKQKDQTAQYLKEGEALSSKMTAINPTFQVPRF